VTDVGPRLRRLRQAKGWAQWQMGERCGVAQSKISEIERGKRMPGVRILMRLCAALRVRLKVKLVEID